jgi:hypothetical protein
MDSNADADLRRNCIHEAGHFLVAYIFNPQRAVSIRIGSYVSIDSETKTPYTAAAQTVTFDFDDSLPKVLVTIRAGGIAAESVVFGEEYGDLIKSSEVRYRIKTDTDNAKQDLQRHRLITDMNDPTFPPLWEMGLYDALSLLKNRKHTLTAIADYCMANLNRDILREELAANVDLGSRWD